MILEAKCPLRMPRAASNRPAPRRVTLRFGWHARREFRSLTRRWARAPCDGRLRSVSRGAWLSERDYGQQTRIERAEPDHIFGHDTVEKPPFLMGRTAGGPEVDVRQPSLCACGTGVLPRCRSDRRHRGDPSPRWPGRLGGRLDPDPEILALRRDIPRAYTISGPRSSSFPMIPQQLGAQCLERHAGGRHRLPRQSCM